MRPTAEAGFSILELTVATAIMLAVTASVFAMLNPAQGAFSAEPEAADMQQRLRVAADTLSQHLVMAGAGAYHGAHAGSLIYRFAPVLPFRRGTAADDPPGTFKTDTITLMYVPATNAQSTLASGLNDGAVTVNTDPGCPTGDPSCGFAAGMTVLMYDDSGNYDTFAIASVAPGGQLQLANGSGAAASTVFDAASTRIAQAAALVYYLKTDPVNNAYQLMVHDGSAGNDVPVADHIVGLSFEYYGEPQPAAMTRPLSDPAGPWTTYGPRPALTAIDPFGVGENCVFMNDESPVPAPRLATLGDAAAGLVPLTAAQLTDGPWCPNAASQRRWDADLLRIRTIGVAVRVQAANAALRGPAGALFLHGGASSGGNRWLPDQEVRFQVAPRNLNVGR